MSNHFGRQNLRDQTFHHILLWMPNWIGDVVLVIPSLQALRKRYPEARLTAVSRAPASELLSHLSFIDSVIHVSFTREDSVLDQLHFARRLAKYDFDLALVFPNSWRSAFMVYLSGTQKRLGYATEQRGIFLTHPQRATAESKTEYRVDYFFKILSPLGLERLENGYDRFINKEEEPLWRKKLAGMNIGEKDFLIVLHPGASKPPRGWHTDRFGNLCQKLIREYDAQILLLGSRDDSEMVDRIKNHCPPDRAHALLDLRLVEIAAVIQQANLFIGNDSGIMHLAAMAGTPVVGIFGPGNPLTTGPYIAPEKLEVVTRNYSCSPCRQRFFKECKPSPHGKPYCIEDISVKDVSEAVERLVKRIRAGEVDNAHG